jgi:methylmalonyl-CoA mutase
MENLFSSFGSTSKSEWVALLEKELKGESIDQLQKVNPIEEIAYPSYFHRSDKGPEFSDPGVADFTRGVQHTSNDWHIGTCFRITTTQATNLEILSALMAGTTALVVHATDDASIDFSSLFSSVELQYIHTTFYPQTTQQAFDFAAFVGGNPAALVCEFNQALIAQKELFSNANLRPYGVNAYAAQQAGASTWQELAIALATGHELLVQQLDAGVAIDQAANAIHFVLGIGNNYFFEISKIRAFRSVWAQVVNAYEPKTESAKKAIITAQTGFVRISLKDPYTNLLRQTTEGMSAVIGGVFQLVIQPYDWHATPQKTDFTRRMATNISLLLKEESYMHHVIDPAGGAYAIDNLTVAIAERTWSEFQWIEKNGGIEKTEVVAHLKASISEKASLRLEKVQSKADKIIGINSFENPDKSDYQWQTTPKAWKGLSSFIIDKVV